MVIIEPHLPLRSRKDRPRMAGRPPISTGALSVGEWSLAAAVWTDCHQHEEINYVLEGELHVECDGSSAVVGPGDFVVVPAGSRARYAAPTYARMVFVYGPSEDGHACSQTDYVELDGSTAWTGTKIT